MRELPEGKPEIDYPTCWGYRLVGLDAEAVREAVADVLKGLEYELRESNVSRSGKYQAFAVELVVQDEAMRLRLFEEFKQHPAIMYVL